jgi:hypothetical protein
MMIPFFVLEQRKNAISWFFGNPYGLRNGKEYDNWNPLYLSGEKLPDLILLIWTCLSGMAGNSWRVY